MARVSWVEFNGDRVNGYSKTLVSGDHSSPYNYWGYGGICTPLQYYYPPLHEYRWLTVDVPNCPPIYRLTNDYFDSGLNVAWDRFISAARHAGNVGLGQDFGDRRQSFVMIARRATSIWRAYRALRRGEFRKFLKILRIRAKRKHRNWRKSIPKEAGALFLEYHYGWSPLITDVYDALKVLTSSHSGKGVKVSASHFIEDSQTYYHQWKFVTRIFCKQAGFVKLDNPNLFLLTTLGLINPVAIGWEVVPFSFVVDWFVNVDQVLNGYTDLMGLSITDSYHTVFGKGTLTTWWSDSSDEHATTSYWSCHRRVGLQKPILAWQGSNPFDHSWQRAASAISLLLQGLKT